MRKLIPVLCTILALLMLTGCAHPWRIAPDPNPPKNEEDVVNQTTVPSENPDASQEIETAVPDTEAPLSDEPTAELTESVTEQASVLPPEDTPSPTEASSTESAAPSASPTPEQATPTPASTPTPTPTPTAAPTPTPKPTPTPAPTPAPTPTPKPADIPPFAGQTINGHGTITNSIFATCRVTMVNVWATTCAPCIAEMPHIQQLYNNYSGRGLKVISVLGDSEQPGCIQQGLNIINSIGFTLPVMRNKPDVAAAFPAGAYPMTYFIDSNGNILRIESTSHTYEQWEAIVRGLLG